MFIAVICEKVLFVVACCAAVIPAGGEVCMEVGAKSKYLLSGGGVNKRGPSRFH